MDKQLIVLNEKEFSHCLNIHKKMIVALAEENLTLGCNRSFNVMTLAIAMTLEIFVCQLEIDQVDDYLGDVNNIVKELHKLNDADKGLNNMYFKDGKEVSKEDLN